METRNEAFAEAVVILGGPANSARLLKKSIQAVLFWVDGRRELPAAECPTIERLTGIPCERLRPDVEWSVLRENRPRPTLRLRTERGAA